MAKKKTNEIVEEQRRARQEFLELKKMQHGEIPTGPKPSEVAIVPKTPREKLKNIWYHDKYIILGALAACIVIIVMVAQCCSRVSPDLQILVFTYTPVSDASCEKIARFSEEYCADINGDGQVSVQVINCSFSKDSSNTQYQYTMMQKLQATIAANDETLLYITDPESAQYFEGEDSPLSGCFDEPFQPLNEAFYAACTLDEDSNAISFELPEGLKMACRSTDAQAFKHTKKLEEYLKYSKEILKAATE